MIIEKIILNEERNVSLTAYLQEVGGKYVVDARPGIVVIPGGAYAYCSAREAEPIVFEFLKCGFQAFVLNYTVKSTGKWPDPLDDYEQAMELIIKNSDKWHVVTDKIAVVGFSAGGHLAACAATIAKHKPAAAILGYPALRREVLDMCMDDLPSPIELVDYDTVPCFLFGARDDLLVPTENIVDFEKSLCLYGIQFESHIYSYGKHGFSSAERWLNNRKMTVRLPGWLSDSIQWLNELFGEFNPKGFGEPAIQPRLNADNEEYLSADCSIQYLYKQDTGDILEPVYRGLEDAGKERNASLEKMILGVKEYTLRELMGEINLTEDDLRYFDEELRKVKNKK